MADCGVCGVPLLPEAEGCVQCNVETGFGCCDLSEPIPKVSGESITTYCCLGCIHTWTTLYATCSCSGEKFSAPIPPPDTTTTPECPLCSTIITIDREPGVYLPTE